MNSSVKGCVCVVHGSLLLRDCLVRALSSELGHEVLGVDSIEGIAGRSPSDIALVILNFGEDGVTGASPVEEVSQFQALYPGVSIAVISDAACGLHGHKAFLSDLKGVISSSEHLDIVVAAVRLILAGGRYSSEFGSPGLADDPGTLWTKEPVELPPSLPSSAAVESLDPAERPSFTIRELQVLECLGQGFPNKTIANCLELSENTVKVHLRRIMRKLNVKNRTEAALVCRAGQFALPLGRAR